MSQLVLKNSVFWKFSVFFHMTILCLITSRYNVGASAVLANGSHGADFWKHLELDEEYMKNLNSKLLDESKDIQNDPSRDFQEPPMMDRDGPLFFEDGSRSWSDWSSKENTWTEWTSWTQCVQGYRHRSRACRDSQCRGSSSDSLACSTSVLSRTTALWSEWASWSSCGDGQQRRARQCMTSDRKSYSSECYGDTTIIRPCERQGSWSDWESWSPCKKGLSTQTRQRGCTSNSLCDGKDKQLRLCPLQTDTSSWSSWGAWSACNKEKRSRTRSCRGEYACVGTAYETSSCGDSGEREQWSSWNGWINTGKWSSWGAWSTCSSGIQIRHRTCASSGVCSGRRQESIACYGSSTPSYSRGYWGQWSACNGGYQVRYWTCTSNKNTCGTSPAETRPCGRDTRVSAWSSWSSWGTQTQRPVSIWSQWSAWTSNDSHTRTRQSQTEWGSWSAWSPCKKGIKRRRRTCSGTRCKGNADETLTCHIQVLPNHSGERKGSGARTDQSSSEEHAMHKTLDWIHKN